MKTKDNVNILLLQIREDAETLREEHDEFTRYGELKPEQITCLNAFEDPHFTPHIIDGYDALFVGGSSDASVLKPDKYPFIESCLKLIRHCYEHDIPVLASCFGFQLAVVEFGGEVIEDKPNMEMGIYEIILSEHAADDPIFHKTPERFYAISGHKERASRLPDNVIELARSERCPYHAFKFNDKPFYAFQFHPEVDRQDLITRITRYEQRYFDDDPNGLSNMIENMCHETPHSNQVITDFVKSFLSEVSERHPSSVPLC